MNMVSYHMYSSTQEDLHKKQGSHNILAIEKKKTEWRFSSSENGQIQTLASKEDAQTITTSPDVKR